MTLDTNETAEVELLPPKDDAGAVTEVAAETPADAVSSTATDDSKPAPEGAASIVQDVLAKRAAPEEAAASSATSEEDGSEPEDPASKTEDDYADVPFNKHPRFQHLLRERNELKLDAQRYRNVQGFLDREQLSGEDAANGLMLLARVRNDGLTGDEMVEGLSVLALAKKDPAGAFERMRPWLQKIVAAAGEVLPDDIAQQVQTGRLSQEAAFELSRARARLNSYEARQTFEQQQAVLRQQTEAQRAVAEAVSSWEADRQVKDPNFHAKVPAIRAEIERQHALGFRPATVDGIREQLHNAYRTVNGRMGAEATNANRAAAPRVAPPRPAIKPVMGGQVAGNTGSEPQSTEDHVARVLARRRTG